MKGLTQEGSGSSSMRVTLLTITMMTCLICLAIVFTMVYKVIYDGSVDYNGMAVLLGASTGPLTGATIGKAIQKGYERSAPSPEDIL